MKRMRIKERFKTIGQFLSFALYPKITIIACFVITIILCVLLGFIMNCFDHDSTGYAVVFSFITGASASFIVAIVVELTNNYRHNKLAWYELQEYYSAVYDFELHKRFLMNNTPVQRDDSFSNMGSDNKVDDLSKDIVEVTWDQIPELIPVFKETLEKKKAIWQIRK